MRLSTLISVCFAGILLLSACGASPAPEKRSEPVRLDATLWGARSEAPVWTASALAALDTHGAPLVQTVPADIETYCPAYPESSEDDRKAFWVVFLSALAKHESTWRPDVSGGGGAWHGLLQISPGTARSYGCRAQAGSELKNGALNLSCGIRIMAETVTRDGVISRGMRGVAADWGPFHKAEKRADIQAVTRRAPVCRG